MPIMTDEILENSKTASGAWTRAQLKVIGVEWPPRKGWRQWVIGKNCPEEAIARFKSASLVFARQSRTKRATEESKLIVTKKPSDPDITIYTDGGCWPNDGTGKGGWGFVCVETGFEDCGGAEPTTNNRMEIEAVIAAIWHHREINGIGQSLRIVSDSQYVVNACTNWMKKWKASGWRKSGGLKNADLWQQMDEAMEGVDVRFEWVRGHNGNEYNELADRLAEKGAQGGSVAEVDAGIDREFAEMFR